MPEPTYINVNVEYVFYKTFIFLKKSYLFFMNINWPNIFSWAKIIAAIIIILFVAGIVYNLIGIYRVRKKEEEEL